jgi:predicted TIM-barrel fold metal-dependent hydrolase
MWASLEALEMPVVFHVADPETFWDAKLAPAWAKKAGWVYDETFPSKEALYAEVDHILERHPRLNLIFAHFYFLSADLERGGRFFDAHPNVCFDLTPGSEMYANFTRNYEATRAFFIHYQDRLLYGTDISSGSLRRTGERSMKRALACAWVVRTFLETDKCFTPPAIIARWLEDDLEGFHGLGLPRQVLEKIYHANFERLFGPSPAPLNREAAVAELERVAAVLETYTGNGSDQVSLVLKDLAS